MPAARKRLALLGPAYPYRGGIAHFLEHIGEGLRERGHDVRVFTFTRQYPDVLFPGKTQMAPEASSEGAEGELIPDRVLDTLNPISWSRTASSIAEFGADALVLKYWMPFFAPAFGSIIRRLRRRGIPSVVVVDNAIPHERRPGDIVLGRYVLRAASGLVAMSDSVRKDIEDQIRVNVPVTQRVHPIYDNFGAHMSKQTARAALGIKADVPLLLFFGFVRRYKGLDVLLRAMPRILEQLPDAQLLIAGESYGEADEYRKLIAALPGGAARWDADYIPDDGVGAYFCAADVIVQPYVSATQSGVAQIAYHFERPMIVTNVGGLPEVVAHGEAGLVVPPSDPDALADAVIKYFRERMEDALAARVAIEKQKFGWDPFYEAIESLV